MSKLQRNWQLLKMLRLQLSLRIEFIVSLILKKATKQWCIRMGLGLVVNSVVFGVVEMKFAFKKKSITI